MKPIYLLLLLLMATGFFACTTNFTQEVTEITPAPEGKSLDATAFAEVSEAFVELDLFDEESFKTTEGYGVMDVRLYLNEAGENVDADFLFDAGFTGTDFMEDILAGAPDRAWEQTITLSFEIAEAARLQDWLTHHFSGARYLDLRIIVLESGTITVQGLRPSAADRKAYPARPLF